MMIYRKRNHSRLAIQAFALLFVLAFVQLSRTELTTNQFGFIGKEIFPIDHLISHLRSADLDADGLEDLMVVNNLRSKITLLFNETGVTNAALTEAIGQKRGINELPPDARFRIESIASEKRITSIVIADLNGDNLPDFAYYGDPKELVVQYNEGGRVWGAPRKLPVIDGLLNPNALTAGDLNNDDRIDLLMLAEHHAYWCVQRADGSLAEPVRIPYSGTVQAIQVLDIQGDGLEDLLFVNWDNLNPFRFRLQNSQGHLGPEIHFSLQPIRSYWADDLDGDGRAEVVTIAQKSGRAQIAHFTQKPGSSAGDGLKDGHFDLFPLYRTTKAERGMVWGDIDGDGLADLLVSEPDSGQLTAYLQGCDGEIGSAKTFPTLSGISDLKVADWDSDGRAEIFMLSLDERQIGVTRFESNGRIPFPKLLPIKGRPLRMDVGRFSAGRKPEIAVVTDDAGKRSIQIIAFDGELREKELSADFKSNPKSVLIADLNQDDLNDLIIMIPYEKIKVLMQTSDGAFDERDLSPPGGIGDLPWIGTADVDDDGRDELLLAQKNFIRAVVVEQAGDKRESGERGTWTFSVKDQINGVTANSRIVAGTALRRAEGSHSSLILLDAELKVLTVCDRDDSGVWQVARSLSLPVNEFTDVRAVQFGNERRNSIVLLGNNAVGRVTFAGATWEFTELDGYESPILNSYLHDVISGDLDQDGRKDLVFLETGKSYVDIVTYEAPHRLVPANRWRVFEERSFRSRRVATAEPREALIGDFNNDRKNDLVVLVHDRIILYPQE